jgi:hypothetical protein
VKGVDSSWLVEYIMHAVFQKEYMALGFGQRSRAGAMNVVCKFDIPICTVLWQVPL